MQQNQKSGDFVMEWAHDSFQDGEVFMIRITEKSDASSGKYTTEAFGLTIEEDGDNTYSKFTLVGMNWNAYIHKVFVSASERYVSYQKNGDEGEDHAQSQLFFCKLDKAKMTLSDEVAITLGTEPGNQWYAHFTKDDRFITYSSNQDGTFRVYAYELATGETTVLTQHAHNHWYPSSAGGTTPLLYPNVSGVDDPLVGGVDDPMVSGDDDCILASGVHGAPRCSVAVVMLLLSFLLA